MNILLFLLCLLTGCGLRQPNVCMPDVFVEGDYVADQQGPDVSLSYWWEQFHDDKLNALIEKALSCNIDLRIAREKICEARAVYGMEFSYLLPWVDQTDVFDRMRNSQTLVSSAFNGGTFVNYFQSGFDSIWEIDLFGKQMDRARAAGMDFIGQAEEVRQIHVSVAAEVASFYFAILSYQQQIDITRKHIIEETYLVTMLQDRFDAGIDPALDLFTAKSVLSARQSDIPKLEMRRKQAIYSLAVLLALNPEELQDQFTDNTSLPSAEGKIPLGLPSELLCRRGDVRKAEYQLAAAGARVLAARKELFPTLSLQSFFEFATGRYSELFTWDSTQWSYAPSFLLPLFHGGHIRSFIRGETSKQHQAILSYELAVLKALQEVESGLVGYFQQQLRLKAKEAETSNYIEAHSLAQVLYSGGMTDFLFLIELERLSFFSEIELIETQNDLLIQLISIYKALGGGWEC